MANFDMVATLVKFLHDIVDTQVKPARETGWDGMGRADGWEDVDC